jgi:hypothetical protein
MDALTGALVVATSLAGSVRERYGSWDRFVR